MSGKAFSIVALGLSVVALVVSVVVLVRDHGSDRHRCGTDTTDPRFIACVGDDVPLDYKRRLCAPIGRRSGVMLWQCRKPLH
jgi:hypothetical protein